MSNPSVTPSNTRKTKARPAVHCQPAERWRGCASTAGETNTFRSRSRETIVRFVDICARTMVCEDSSTIALSTARYAGAASGAVKTCGTVGRLSGGSTTRSASRRGRISTARATAERDGCGPKAGRATTSLPSLAMEPTASLASRAASACSRGLRGKSSTGAFK